MKTLAVISDKIIYIFILLLFAAGGFAQPPCDDNVDAGDDVTICDGEQVQLNASTGGGHFFFWSWVTHPDIADIYSLYPIVSPSQTTTYTFHAYGVTGEELIVNGDFSTGDNTGFISEYTYSPGDLWSAATYDILTNPSSSHSAFSSCSDHTTGSGMMMVVNGAEIANTNVWCETITVDPNTDYAFSTWLCSVYPGDPAILQFSINGTLLGSPFQAEYNTCIWNQFYELWNSGSNTSAEICIVNQNTAGGGNDFAIDDISFMPVCESIDEVTVTVFNGTPPDLGNDVSICEGETTTLDAGAGYENYLWSTGAVTQTITVSQSGTYSVTVNACGDEYYDDVQVTVYPLPDVNLGNDTTVCIVQPYVITAGTEPGNSYLWQDATVNSTYVVTTSGIYSVTVTSQYGCSSTDEITIQTVNPPVEPFSGDTSLCEGQSVILDAGAGYDSYQWHDGSVNQTYTAEQQGIYSVTVTNICGSASGSFEILNVNPNPEADLGNDTVICANESLVLYAGSDPENTYIWQDGSGGETYIVTTEGSYLVTVTNVYGCTAWDMIDVSTIDTPSVDLGEDTYLCSPQIILDAGEGNSDYDIEWQDGSSGITYIVTTEGTYYITVSNNCGTDSDTIIISECPECIINLPNAFSPNGDGQNDVLYLRGNGYTEVEFLLFNRFGELVFRTTDPNEGWDGTFRGVQQGMQVYVYYIKATCLDGGTSEKKGNVTLLR